MESEYLGTNEDKVEVVDGERKGKPVVIGVGVPYE